MSGLLIRDIPPALYQRLKDSAAKHHRSLSKEALAIIEEVLEGGDTSSVELPRPFKGRFPLTDELLQRARREGRA